MRVVALILLTALPAGANQLAFPYLSGEDGSFRWVTSIIVRNNDVAPAICTFHSREYVAREVIPAGGETVFPDFLPAKSEATAIRTNCSTSVVIAARIQTSSDRGATFDEGELYRAIPLDPQRSVWIAAPQRRLSFAEVNGHAATVTLTFWREDEIVSTTTRGLGPWDVRLIELGPTFGDPSALTIELEVTDGEGRIVAAVESTDRHLDDMTPQIVGTLPRRAAAATPIHRLIVASTFKAAPFQDPATGLVYMRERWYDPKTGTFLGPDPMGYLDAPNLYSFGAGDPVNTSDPTGLALYAFDGTWNDREKMRNTTNVAKLVRAYDSGVPVYRKGVGTDWYSSIMGGLAGWGGKGRVRAMIGDLTEIYNSGDQVIDVIGFSRGASLALTFVNEIARYGIYDSKLRTRVFPDVRFLGLFDTVGSFGMPGDNINIGHSFAIPPNVKTVRHAIAGNEYRSTFPLTRLTNPNCASARIIEETFRGAHADIGGGYEDNDMLSRHPLQWMWSEMVAAGVRMKPLARQIGTVPPGAEVIEHKSHESILYLSDWLRVGFDDLIGRKSRRRTYTAPCYGNW